MTPESEDNTNNNRHFDELLSKYLSVWLWSILFGGTTTLTFSLANVTGYEKWGTLAWVIAMLLAIDMSFLIVSWLTLYQFLRSHLIYGIFLDNADAFDIENKEKAGRYLNLSFYSLIMAGVVRLMIELVKQFFQLI